MARFTSDRETSVNNVPRRSIRMWGFLCGCVLGIWSILILVDMRRTVLGNSSHVKFDVIDMVRVVLC